MPDYFSHYILAEKIYERLGSTFKNKIRSYDLYLLGAQGGDVFFAYNIKLSRSNLGRALHNMPAEELFEILKDGNPSYAAGFATHYALDCTLHPAVYAYENTHRSPFAHQRLESDLGLYISRYYRVRRSILPRERVLACTSAVYDSIKTAEPSITMTGIERCLKRHFDFTRWLYKTKRQTYKCDFDFTSLSGAIADAEQLGITAVTNILEGNVDEGVFGKSFLQK